MRRSPFTILKDFVAKNITERFVLWCFNCDPNDIVMTNTLKVLDLARCQIHNPSPRPRCETVLTPF